MMNCMLCDNDRFRDHLAYGDRVTTDIVSDKVGLGMLGLLFTGISVEADEKADDEFVLTAYSETTMSNSCHTVKIPIKYCPFCGKELGN